MGASGLSQPLLEGVPTIRQLGSRVPVPLFSGMKHYLTNW